MNLVPLTLLAMATNLAKLCVLFIVSILIYGDQSLIGEYTKNLVLISPFFLLSGLRARQLILHDTKSFAKGNLFLPVVALGALIIVCICVYRVNSQLLLLLAFVKFFETIIDTVLAYIQVSHGIKYIVPVYYFVSISTLLIYSLTVFFTLEQVMFIEVILLFSLVIFLTFFFRLVIFQYLSIGLIQIKKALRFSVAGFLAGLQATVILYFLEGRVPQESLYYFAYAFTLGSFTNKFLLNYFAFSNFKYQTYKKKSSVYRSNLYLSLAAFSLTSIFASANQDVSLLVPPVLLIMSNVISQHGRQLLIADGKFRALLLFNFIELIAVVLCCCLLSYPLMLVVIFFCRSLRSFLSYRLQRA